MLKQSHAGETVLTHSEGDLNHSGERCCELYVFMKYYRRN